MSALAKLCFSKGVFVSGSDKTQSDVVDELIHLGINVAIGHKKSNVEGADLVVYTCAVGEDNVELMSSKKQGIPVMERSDFLAELSKEFKTVIAIAGSHGKTTVCSLVGQIFKTAGLNPTIIVGGKTESGNLTIGGNQILIVEACEYKRHFLKLKHDISLILNIDYDHPDCYKNAKEYMLAFEQFASTTTKQNFVGEKYKSFLQDNNAITYGVNGDFVAKNVKHLDDKIEFDVYKQDNFYDKYILNMIGFYNVVNALCAIALCDFFGIDKKIQKNVLKDFVGVKRRYEYMGKLADNIIIADYAHHPTQLKKCIQSTKLAYKKQVVVVFEPHTYTRTKALFNEFISALDYADCVELLPTYSAREKTIKGGTSKDIYVALCKKKKNVKLVTSYEKCFEHLKKVKNSVILLLGAGSIYTLAEHIKLNYLHK